MTIFKTKDDIFSTKKTMNVVFFVLAVATWAIAIIFNYFGKSLQPEVFTFMSVITSASFIQYVAGKKIDGGK